MKRKKYLFIDGQVFQSPAWSRGMGKYSLNLLRAMVNNKSYNYSNSYIIFNKNSPLDAEVETIIKEIYEFRILYLDLKIPEDITLKDTRKFEQCNRTVLNKAIDKIVHGKKQADFLLLALFTHQTYATFPDKTRNILLWYDLIPLLYSERYSKSPAFENYLNGYRVVLRANLILAISETSADDLAIYIGISRNKIHSINGAAIDLIHKEPSKLKKLEKSKFVLMPSGDDMRKNNHMAVKGFADYCKNYPSSEIKLVITSTFTNEAKSELFELVGPDKLIFTDNVSEETLSWLYKNALTVLFVSEYEGLGLPVLEAVQFDKPIVCSSIRVFKEISEGAFYYVNEHDGKSISRGLKDAIYKKGWDKKKNKYSHIAKKYTWKNTASEALKLIDQNSFTSKRIVKKKIAILCPDPAGYSAIGKVVMQQHAALSELYEIDYYTECAVSDYGSDFQRISYLDKVANVRDAALFNPELYRKYEAVIYHIGNSEFHAETIKNALYLPGITIVHDSDISGLFSWVLRDREYVDADRILAEEYINQLNKNHKTNYLTSLVNSQRAVVVHSKYAKKAIGSAVKNTPIVKANLPVGAPKILKSVTEGEIKIGIAGILAPVKGLALIEEISHQPFFSNCKFYIFGISMLEEKDIERIKLNKNIILTTELTDLEFQNSLSELDILINYRIKYRGETSLTVLEALRYGVVPIIRNIGWYGELPDNLVIKVNSKTRVVKSLEEVVSDIKSIRNLREKRTKYILENYNFDGYAQTIDSIIKELNNNSQLRKLPNERFHKALKRGLNKSSLINTLREIIKDDKAQKGRGASPIFTSIIKNGTRNKR